MVIFPSKIALLKISFVSISFDLNLISLSVISSGIFSEISKIKSNNRLLICVKTPKIFDFDTCF